MFTRSDHVAQLAALSRSQAMIEFKLDGTIIKANEIFLNAFGYTLDEVKGANHAMFVETATRTSEDYRRFWSDLRAGKVRTAEFKRIGKGGREVWIQGSYTPVFKSGGGAAPYKILKIATDITAERLRRAEIEGQIAAINRAQGVISFDLTGTVLDANANFLAVLGYRLDEVKGKHHAMFVTPQEHQSAAYRAFWSALAQGQFQADRYRRLGKGGREVWIQASYNPIFDMNGKPLKVVKFATDITKNVDEELSRAAAVRAIDADLGQVVDVVSSVSRDATSTAVASSQTSVNVQAVASGAEELVASVAEISRQVSQARDIGTEAVAQAGRTNTIVSGLSTAAQRIGDVVQLIQTIAAQTNLLALNATIEAARAGEAGQGFAVVASEVKNLATQTAKATEEIAAQIASVQTSTENAVTALDGITSTIRRISDISSAIASAVEEQSAVTTEMSSNMRVAADGVTTISANMNTIAQSTRLIGDAAGKVRAASKALV